MRWPRMRSRRLSCVSTIRRCAEAAAAVVKLRCEQREWRRECVQGTLERDEVKQAVANALRSGDLLVRKAAAFLLDRRPPRLRVALHCRQPTDGKSTVAGNSPMTSCPPRGDSIARVLRAQGYMIVEQTTAAAKAPRETGDADLLVEYDSPSETSSGAAWHGGDAIWDQRHSCLIAIFPRGWEVGGYFETREGTPSAERCFGSLDCWFDRGRNDVLVFVTSVSENWGGKDWRPDFGAPRHRVFVEHATEWDGDEQSIMRALVQTIHEARCDVVYDRECADYLLRVNQTKTQVGHWVPQGQYGVRLGDKPAWAFRAELALVPKGTDAPVWQTSIHKRDPKDYPSDQKLCEEYKKVHASKLRLALEKSVLGDNNAP